MLRKRCVTKRKDLVGIILSLVVVISLIAQPMVTFAEGTSNTVDNSVDKSTTRVVGVLKLTGCTGSTDSFESGLTVYDSEKVKVDYSNPTNDYIQSLIDAAKEKTERLGQVAVDGHSGSCTLRTCQRPHSCLLVRTCLRRCSASTSQSTLRCRSQLRPTRSAGQ